MPPLCHRYSDGWTPARLAAAIRDGEWAGPVGDTTPAPAARFVRESQAYGSFTYHHPGDGQGAGLRLQRRGQQPRPMSAAAAAATTAATAGRAAPSAATKSRTAPGGLGGLGGPGGRGGRGGPGGSREIPPEPSGTVPRCGPIESIEAGRKTLREARHAARIERRRRNEQRVAASYAPDHIRERRRWESDRRVRTIIRHRLQYFHNLESRLAADRERQLLSGV